MTAVNLNLAGRRVVVTGAGGGLGQAMAILMADCGAELVLVGRNPAKLRATAGMIAERDRRPTISIHADFAKPTDVVNAASQIRDHVDHVDILINNAAMWLPGRLENTDEADMADCITSGTIGTALICKGLLPLLRRSSSADIVNIISTAGLPNAQFSSASSAFHASKAGQAGFSDSLRQELKAEGIRVIALYPPDFDDVSPLSAEWNQSGETRPDASITTREVIEAVFFALSAPRTCIVAGITLDNARRVR